MHPAAAGAHGDTAWTTARLTRVRLHYGVQGRTYRVQVVSKQGLTESELEDVLSLDEQVGDSLLFITCDSRKAKRLLQTPLLRAWSVNKHVYIVGALPWCYPPTV